MLLIIGWPEQLVVGQCTASARRWKAGALLESMAGGAIY